MLDAVNHTCNTAGFVNSVYIAVGIACIIYRYCYYAVLT